MDYLLPNYPNHYIIFLYGINVEISEHNLNGLVKGLGKYPWCYLSTIYSRNVNLSPGTGFNWLGVNYDVIPISKWWFSIYRHIFIDFKPH